MRLTPQERDGLRQRFLIDSEVNLDRLIVLVQQAVLKKVEEDVEKVKKEILNLIQDSKNSKEVEDLISKALLFQSK